MKKNKFITLILTIIFALASFGCSSPNPYGDKTVIGISAFGGGHGTAWLEKLANDFLSLPENAEYKEKYVFEINPEKSSENALIDEVSLSNSAIQIIITSANRFQEGFIGKSVFEDLTDVAGREVDGVGNGRIIDKIQDYDTWHQIYSNNGQGLYALPFADSILGLVFDHQLFIDNEWYEFANATDDGEELSCQGITYDEIKGKLYSKINKGKIKIGDVILSKGKDGKFGTYDDGQPTNIADWEQMLSNIDSDKTKCFISSGYNADYTNFILCALFAQYSGADGWNAYFNYDSNGNDIDFITSPYKDTMTLQKGYRINEIEGVYKAYEFMKKYMSTELAWMHSDSKGSMRTNKDAQNDYLLGYKKSSEDPQSAMLIDGCFWEYEAINIFNGLAEGRKYGQREYRFMLLPDMEGQKNNKSVFASIESGTILLGKDSNKSRLACSKDFVAYLLKNENLQYFSSTTGSFMPYDYEITTDQYNNFTKFTQNVYDIYQDKENIQIVKPRLDCLMSPMSFATDRGNSNYLDPKIDGAFQSGAVPIVSKYSLNKIKEGLTGIYSKTTWESWVNKAKNSGYFGD